MSQCRKLRASAPPPPTPPISTDTLPRPSAPPPPAGWRETSTTFPPGLLSLMPLDRIFVDGEQDSVEALHLWESNKQYRVSSANGELIYVALEESDVCSRCCLGKHRGWNFHLLDKHHREIFRLTRSLRCSSCCFPCCLQRMTIHANNQLLGSVRQNCNAWRPSFTILDSLDSPVLYIKGPITYYCIGNVNFRIRSTDKQQSIGTITKNWSGLAKRFFKEGDSFGISFPVDLDVKIKAVLIGACFLIDFIYFQEQSNLRRLQEYSNRNI
ncbi:PREDICTED: phospholipid scramblase 1-like [Ceratosolen solmsi marchali]|uniref:Phospholipid scramblase n=1 Tax=Ceratosolen solmsi marchali TaxID=326594 RepID=A0AAJ6YVB7_9HYME|nr:PREDICTED: phospholipid scramblase 1-like [Ceratosolen solmsi marchali]